MAVITREFGGPKLTGDDAIKFANQLKYGRPNAAAINAVNEGVRLAKIFARDGIVRCQFKSNIGV